MVKANTLIGAVTSVTADFTKEAKKRERLGGCDRGDWDLFGEGTSGRWTVRDAALHVMADAYNKASSDGEYPAHARQIYYAARPEIQELTGKTDIKDNYFTQTLLPDYLASHSEETDDWQVVYDARGHLYEPHTEHEVALGTIDVDDYLADISAHSIKDVALELKDADYPTCGPEHRYGALLFIEKEGFFPLFKNVHLAERYDLAIMSTKGQSVTACRHLVDRICGEQGIPLLVLHDFDHAGFSICSNLQNSNRRYEFRNDFHVVDLGLRLEDVQAYDLIEEDVHSKSITADSLQRYGATAEETAFLRGDGQVGQRVELNAFTSQQMIEWLEAKLEEHGVAKVVPDKASLEAAYRRAVEIATLSDRLEEVKEEARKHAQEAEVPDGLTEVIHGRLNDDPTLSWDKVLADLVSEDTCKN